MRAKKALPGARDTPRPAHRGDGRAAEPDDDHLGEPAKRRHETEERTVDRVDDAPVASHAPLAAPPRLEPRAASRDQLLEHAEEAELAELALVEVADDALDHRPREELVGAVLVGLLAGVRQMLAREVEHRIALRLDDHAAPTGDEEAVDARHHVVDDQVMHDALREK